MRCIGLCFAAASQSILDRVLSNVEVVVQVNAINALAETWIFIQAGCTGARKISATPAFTSAAKTSR
jgi:hypothetical protein